MPIICVERFHFEVIGPVISGKEYGQMGFADKGQEWLYNKLGLISVYMNLRLKCKVCGTVHKGYGVTDHLQKTEHVAARKALIDQVEPVGDWCEDCPMLIQESNPYYDVVETVCRLGFFYEDQDEGYFRAVYRIDEELWRPEMCKERLRR